MEMLRRGGWLGVGLAVVALVVPSGADEELQAHWLKFDADKKLVQLRLVGAKDGTNGTMNFNGYGNGNMTVTVPFGWRLEVEFINKGLGALPHSLVVIEEVSPLPIEGGKPAFPRALTRALVPGLGAGESDTFDFVANREGRFLLFCGTTGHGVAGMWDYLVVSRKAEVPVVHVKAKK
jgi:sulfocyanin